MLISKTTPQSSKNFLQELFPNRTYKSIVDKWNRSLDPSFSSVPFSEQEDKDLLEAIQNISSSNINWKEISRQFPSRKPETLFNRWTMIAPTDEVMNMKKKLLLQRGVKRIGRITRADEMEESVLDSDELVLVFKKRRV